MTKRNVIKTITGFLLLGLLGGGAGYLILAKQQELAGAPRYGVRPLPVQVAIAERGNLTITRDYLALVEANRAAEVSPRLTSTVVRLHRDVGDLVEAGDLLVTLDSREIRERIASLESQISQAKAELAANEAQVRSLGTSLEHWRREAERSRTLAAKGIVSLSASESAENRASEISGNLASAREKSQAIRFSVESLTRRLAEMKTQLSYTRIESPFSGLITRRNVDEGDLAVPGRTLMVVEDRRDPKLIIDIPQQDLPDVRLGQRVIFKTKDGGTATAGISSLHPSLNDARMLRGEVWLTGGAGAELKSGSYVPLSIVISELHDVVLVPEAGLVDSPGGDPYVFVVESGRLAARMVKVLGVAGDKLAVEGVAADEAVVLSTYLGWVTLSSGLQVESIR